MTGEQIVYKATGRPAREVLAEEAAAGNYTRIEVAEQMGLTVPQMDALLYKHGIRWGYAGRPVSRGGATSTQSPGESRKTASAFRWPNGLAGTASRTARR